MRDEGVQSRAARPQGRALRGERPPHHIHVHGKPRERARPGHGHGVAQVARADRLCGAPKGGEGPCDRAQREPDPVPARWRR